MRDEANALCGGLYGWTWADWLEIRYLWAREDTRGHGHGRELLFAAEQEAKARGCDYALVDTFSFQAPELYRRLGYIEFASLDGFPGQHRRCGVP